MIKNLNKKFTFWGLILAMFFVLKYVLFFTIFIPLSVKYGPAVKEWCVQTFMPSKIVKKSGNIELQDRKLDSFDKIKISGRGRVILSQNEKNSVKIEGDKNILPFIETELKDNTLIIRPKKGLILKSAEDLKFYVNAKNLKEINLDKDIHFELLTASNK
jgi:hypothetical protein